MYYKIAPIILNSSKATGLSDVFVAQPDSLKENLAGKIFVLSEIGGKKTDAKKIFNFIVFSLSDNYYNDEKILFRDKIEGLKVENIFEASLAKTNKDLSNFLLTERLRLNPTTTNITLGVIFENGLYFTHFGHNRSVLFYQRAEKYEIVNVEANVADINNSLESIDGDIKSPKLFSSVISGEIPLGSYFLFSNEALLEYLSGKELINIITKLPPITAAEQIKSVLDKINNHVPFLGLIIKNTVGLSQELKEELAAYSSPAQNSASSLNNTEEKTEQMLTPVGIISFSKIIKSLKQWLGNKKVKIGKTKKSYINSNIESNSAQAPLDLGSIKSLNLARSDSFLKTEKIFFKKQSGGLISYFQKIIYILTILFSWQFWKKIILYFKNLAINLNLKNRYLFLILGSLIIVLVTSIYFTNLNRVRKEAQDSFNSLVAQIDEKNNNISSHLLYNDEEGAKNSLSEAESLLSSLPKVAKEQRDVYNRLNSQLEAEKDKIQKIIRVLTLVKANDFKGLNLKNIVFVSGNIFASSDKLIYSFKPGVVTYQKTDIKNVNNLKLLLFDNKDKLYFVDTNKIVEFNIKTRDNSQMSVSELEPGLALGQASVFNNNLYVLNSGQNQIFKYTSSANGFSSKSAWLKEAADLSSASSFLIDGDIYILKTNGQIDRFFKGKKTDFKSWAVSPTMTKAQKMLASKNYIYIFEATSKRLVILSRQDGHLINQYIYNSLNNPLDFTVDESTKSVYFLDGDILWKDQLK